MTQWMRQHRESVLYWMPWHIEDPRPTNARMLGLLLMVCGTTTYDRSAVRHSRWPCDDWSLGR